MITEKYQTLEAEKEDFDTTMVNRRELREVLVCDWPQGVEAYMTLPSYLCSIELKNPEDDHKVLAHLVRKFGSGEKRFYGEEGYFYWAFSTPMGIPLHLNKVSAGKCKIVSKVVQKTIYESVCPEDSIPQPEAKSDD